MKVMSFITKASQVSIQNNYNKNMFPEFYVIQINSETSLCIYSPLKIKNTSIWNH